MIRNFTFQELCLTRFMTLVNIKRVT